MNDILDPAVIELVSALEEAEELLEKECAEKEAALVELEKLKADLAAMKGERDAMRSMHGDMHAKMSAEIEEHRAAHMAEMERRVAAETSLAAERAKPAPKPEQVLVPVEKLVHGPVPQFKMTVNRDRNGRIIEALISAKE